MPIKETDFDSVTVACRYLGHASIWVDAAAVTLDTTSKYSGLKNNPEYVKELQKISRAAERLRKRLEKILDDKEALHG